MGPTVDRTGKALDKEPSSSLRNSLVSYIYHNMSYLNYKVWQLLLLFIRLHLV